MAVRGESDGGDRVRMFAQRLADRGRMAWIADIPHPQGAALIARGQDAPIGAERDGGHVIVGARRGSPLIVGVSEGENFLASDANAIAPHTRQVIYLNDYDVVTLTPEQADHAAVSLI